MRLNTIVAVMAATLVVGAQARAAEPPGEPGPEAKAEGAVAPAPPPPASLKQALRLGAQTLAYTVTVGALPVMDKGKRIADVVYTAYTLDGAPPNRPVTFAFNGGPGSASVYLNLGALGPRRVGFGGQNDPPSRPAVLEDNPQTWLAFTDLVFVDPVGTGFSRLAADTEDNRKKVYGVDADAAYLARFVADWLTRFGRLTSPKYLVGESYGGVRVPKLAHRLQVTTGVGVSGLVLVSPVLDYTYLGATELDPLPYVARLPSQAAARLEHAGQPLTPQAMAGVEDYARTAFLSDLMQGRHDPAARQRLAARVTELTGLDAQYVSRLGGRIDNDSYVREVRRDRAALASEYDANVTALDPYPEAAEKRAGDPIIEGMIAPVTSAMADFVTHTVGWKTDAPYVALSSEVNKAWDYGDGLPESVKDLRQVMALDATVKVLVAHGYTDVLTPYFGSRLILDQFPALGDPDRIRLAVFPGGHMFYSREASRDALRREAQAIYAPR